MEHSKGPWIIDETHRNEMDGMMIWSDDVIVAHVVQDQHCDIDANARLIAASPDLFSACKEGYEALRDIINAADNKAPYTAEQLASEFSGIADLLYEAMCKAGHTSENANTAIAKAKGN